MLISSASLLAFTDHIAYQWEDMKARAGSTADASPAAGTYREIASRLLAVAVGANDYEIESDLATPCENALAACGVEAWVGLFQQPMTALGGHCQRRGKSVDATIVGLASYLTFLNQTPFSALLAPGFADAYRALFSGSVLPPAAFFSRGVSPDLNAAAYPNGMGVRAVGGAFVAGAAPDLTRYSAALPVVVVTADFTAGTAPPQVVLAGADSNGSTSTSWTLTLDANNPASAVATTITPAVAAKQRQTVALGSAAGIVAGSVLTVNAGLPDQEAVVAEAVAGGNLTAVFMLAHAPGATLAGRRSYLPPPSAAGVRMAALTGITLNLTGHAAGGVRIDGAQDRVAI